jgi:hypothetical protein
MYTESLKLRNNNGRLLQFIKKTCTCRRSHYVDTTFGNRKLVAGTKAFIRWLEEAIWLIKVDGLGRCWSKNLETEVLIIVEVGGRNNGFV